MSQAPSARAQEALREARDRHRAGDFAGAIAAYDEALAADGALAEAWHLKALALHQSGRLAEASESAARAIALAGEQPPLLMLAGTILHDRGELEAAERMLSRLAAVQPAWAPAHVALGQVRMDRGNAEGALEAFRAATQAQPGNARAWNNVGVALLALRRRDEARAAFERSRQADPRYALASFNLARWHEGENADRALTLAEDAVRADPALADAWLLIGDLHRRRHDAARAIAAINTAIERAPANPRGWNARAGLIAESGDVQAARREYAAVSARFPADLRSALGANLLLPRVYADAAHLARSRDEYAAGLEALHARAEGFRFTDAETALTDSRWTNFYLAYQGRNDRELQHRYATLQRRILERAVPAFFGAIGPRPARGKVRVGFFSHFFFNCVVGRYFASWVTRLDRSRFEIFVYYTNDWMANDTRAIAAASDVFRHVAGTPLHAVARQVVEDELDVLVYPELGMHPDSLTFSAMRLAPVQCAAWGHPTTTGSPAIDWFISCEGMEPPGAQTHYTERLAMLPGLGTRYDLPAIQGDPSRQEFGLPPERVLYLVPQSLFKIHPDNDALLARVLAGHPEALAVMFDSSQPLLTQAFRRRLAGTLAQAGVAMDSRVIFLKPDLQHAAYLRLNRVCDVMLDTMHWSGGNTALDALAAGLPLVALPGELMRGRQSMAMLRMAGVPELVAANADEYVDKALALGSDAAARGDVSQRLASGREALFARDEPVLALEDFLERAAKG